MNIQGFLRKDGNIGVRNHVLVLSTVVCANHVVERIVSRMKGAVPFCHGNGCGQIGDDLEQTHRTIAGVGKNPNVAAVLVVGLGCESISSDRLCEEIAGIGKEVVFLNIQATGGSEKAIEKGIRVASSMVHSIAGTRIESDLSCLVVAVRCGGSDSTSGLIANPVVGMVSDMLVDKGGTVIMSGTSEFIGVEHVLLRRAGSRIVEQKLTLLLDGIKAKLHPYKESLTGTQPGAGNIKGGITTLEEKSLGCISLGGTALITEVLQYAQAPSEKGLVIMDTPGVGVESNTATQAAGAQIILFTTGCGSSIGAPVAPIIKITGNPDTFENMSGNIDFNASTVLTGEKTFEEAGMALFDELLAVASGKKTRSEHLGHREAVITRIGPSI